ncbi:tetratricopeptide repeat protein [Lacibacter cauensis]|uniref:Tetratricopeptide repeat protein n=1 Tax=Lacibacter cauensis TaxID=510947 RepID=A0A562SGU9_9BACT|nr:tetratricopeptide repeat protein [Lacibacter cauensis]TWI80501.1 tetratricopeptide repeat protein [Lacibacter cauensis]
MERIEQLRKFLQESPNDSFLKHALALEHVKLGDDETARQLFEELLAANPGYVGSYYHLGKLFERMDDSEAAVAWYEKGMQVAKEKGEQHAYGELRGALEELTF